MKEEYLVFMTNIALAPNAQPRGGELCDTSTLDDAKKIALGEKENWERVIIYQRVDNNHLEKLCAYHKDPASGAPARFYEFK